MSLAEKIHEGLRKHQAKHEAKESKSKERAEEHRKTGKHHFRVEQMDDGTFTIHHRVVPHGKPEYHETSKEETSTHKSIHHVAKHLKESVGVNDEADTARVAGKEKTNPESVNTEGAKKGKSNMEEY